MTHSYIRSTRSQFHRLKLELVNQVTIPGPELPILIRRQELECLTEVQCIPLHFPPMHQTLKSKKNQMEGVGERESMKKTGIFKFILISHEVFL